MDINTYIIYDIKGKFYMNPWFIGNDQQAIRQFTDIANDLQTPIGRHPEDYILFSIGHFDNNHGTLHPKDPVNLGKAIHYVKKDLEPPLFPREYIDPTATPDGGKILQAHLDETINKKNKETKS